MRKYILDILIILLLIPCIVYTIARYRSESNLYSKVTVVTDIQDDIVRCMDFNGNIWLFKGVKDYAIGDYVSLIMKDNGTADNIYDDEIISTNYGGWLNGDFGYDITKHTYLYTEKED